VARKKAKGGGTKKVCLPAAKARSLSESKKQSIINAKEKAGRSGKRVRSSSTNVEGARKPGATLRDWFQKENWINIKTGEECGAAMYGPMKVDKSTMQCNSPKPSSKSNKKKMVKACANGKEKLIHYGEKGYGHNYSDAARKSFKARHKCDQATDKLTARYWACKDLWAGKGGSTQSSPKNKQGKY